MLEDKFISWIVDQQEEPEVELTPERPNKSNTPSRHSKDIVQVLEIVLEDEFIGWTANQQEEAKVQLTPESPNKSDTLAIGMKFDCDESC